MASSSEFARVGSATASAVAITSVRVAAKISCSRDEMRSPAAFAATTAA